MAETHSNRYWIFWDILKQERKGVVKTISLVAKFRDKNNRLIRKNVTLDSEFTDSYEEEVRRRYGNNVRIEALKFYRTRPAIIDDKHARTALALGYVKYGEEIIGNIKDDILKRQLADFKRINKYDEIIEKYENMTPDFIDQYDLDAIEAWRNSQIEENFKKLGFMDKFGNISRSLKRDLRIRENLYKHFRISHLH